MERGEGTERSLADHYAIWTPVEDRWKEGWVGKVLDCSTVLRKFQYG